MKLNIIKDIIINYIIFLKDIFRIFIVKIIYYLSNLDLFINRDFYNKLTNFSKASNSLL